MKKMFSILLTLIAWFAVIAQFKLMMDNRTAPVAETIIRFFSFFTILTNTIVAIFFTVQSLKPAVWSRAGQLTAVTLYITVVGLVYQVLLRHVWSPTGLQKLVDELLHSVVPLLVIIYWSLFAEKKQLQFKQIPAWLMYPLIYLLYVFIRGNYAGFYPYPFVNVTEIGFKQALINSAGITVLFIVIACIFVGIGRSSNRKHSNSL